METATVYLSALQESLQKKQRIMEELLTLTQQQSEVLQQENMDIDVFEQLMAQKEKALGEINILDKGLIVYITKSAHILSKISRVIAVQSWKCRI